MIDASAHEAAARSQPAHDPPSWPALGRALLADVGGAFRERLHLAALEGQQFVHAAGRLLAFGVAAAVLALAAWFVVIAAVISLLVHVGLSLPLALFVGAVLNLLAAVWAWSAMRRQLALMGFPATLRSLAPASAGPVASGAAPSGRRDERPTAAAPRPDDAGEEPTARNVEGGAAP